MILSLSLRTEDGCPGWFDLQSPVKELYFYTKTHERVLATLGNDGVDNNPLPKGFAVHKKALKKEPWIFGKTLYLIANAMMIQNTVGDDYHHQIPLGKALVARAIVNNNAYYAYIIVEPSTDARYTYFPIMVDQ